jgi:hypothetical protein
VNDLINAFSKSPEVFGELKGLRIPQLDSIIVGNVPVDVELEGAALLALSR